MPMNDTYGKLNELVLEKNEEEKNEEEKNEEVPN